MLTLSFDFQQLADRQAFYREFVAQSGCSGEFGCNLDALWDWLTGGMILPATIHLRHAESASEQAEFAPVLALLEEAAQQLQGELRLIRELGV
ncbi:Barstar, RNAse (barnase) inhibitor [Pantoea rodasii]|uniref:Barstar, RNAse (Barnase) inhibitor n=1 Tax=Pantoea rodasii TaxID=1076549 RepID=A0A2M9WIK2_9GAMM|nr:barstar family protein [Pantoea rodasii]ORM64261.1 Barstar, RNAse (barnase) inhibitor [Pantoea rodasii]PJZ07395.1 Barstar, RNAse (barnase) inhibitor [Pantoea rodasii]